MSDEVLEELEKNKNFIPCSECEGTGKGEGCMEQGGYVSGLCPECCGHRGVIKDELVK